MSYELRPVTTTKQVAKDQIDSDKEEELIFIKYAYINILESPVFVRTVGFGQL